MRANIRHLLLTGLLAVGWHGTEAAAQQDERPTQDHAIMNVVLIEMDTSADAKPGMPVLNDWPYWERSAGRLVASLETELGFVRAAGDAVSPDVSLFARIYSPSGQLHLKAVVTIPL